MRTNKSSGVVQQYDGHAKSPNAWGLLYKKMRSDKKRTRAEVLDAYHRILDKRGIDYKLRGEAWLSRIERGRQVEVEPWEIHILMDALQCTRIERYDILRRANRSLLTIEFENEDGSANDGIGMLSMLLSAHPNAPRYIRSLLRDRRARQLNDRELLEVFSEVIKLLLDEENQHERSVGA